MKHLFIINPVAGGKKNSREKTEAEIRRVMAEIAQPYEIYETKAPMDACRKIREEAETGEELRVYACGGDGTLNECVNGAAGFSHVAVTHYPCGTGNDTIKMFGEDKELFFDLEKLVRGFVRPVDLIDCCGRYSLNIVSVGLDARVCQDVHKYSGLPLIGGATAYVVSLLVNMLKGPNTRLEIRVGNQTYKGKFALLCACNGSYYGGGFHPVPEARPDDGVMDSLIVRGVSRLQFLGLVGRYSSGRYREISEKTITATKAPEIRITAEEPVPVNLDGEVILEKDIRFTMVPGAMQMIFPAGMTWFEKRETKTGENGQKDAIGQA